MFLPKQPPFNTSSSILNLFHLLQCPLLSSTNIAWPSTLPLPLLVPPFWLTLIALIRQHFFLFSNTFTVYIFLNILIRKRKKQENNQHVFCYTFYQNNYFFISTPISNTPTYLSTNTLFSLLCVRTYVRRILWQRDQIAASQHHLKVLHLTNASAWQVWASDKLMVCPQAPYGDPRPA